MFLPGRQRGPASQHRLPRHVDSALPRITTRIVAATAVVLTVLLLGTAGFHRAGNGAASWSDALYMALITVSTVGYNEAVPLDSTADRVFAGALSIVGFGALTFLFTSLSVFFLEKDFDQTLWRRRMQKQIRKLKGHYIVCGFGRVGRNIARELQQTGRDFVAIDLLPARLEEHREDFPGLLYLQGDASDDALLLAADIADAAGVFAVTGDDSRNLMITVTARQLNPSLRVVARAHEVRNIPKIRRAGADDVVSPDFTGGMRIASAMVRPNVVNFIDEMLHSDRNLRLEEITVPQGFAPTRLAKLQVRASDYLLVAVRDGAQWHYNPEDDFLLQPGDVIVAMASPAGRAVILAHLAEFST